MEVTYSVEEAGEISRNISIDIPREIFNAKFDQVVNQTAKQAQIKGFRAGRVPKTIVIQRYGEGIKQDVIWEIVQSTLERAVNEKNIRLVDIEKFDIEPDEANSDLRAVAGISVFPEPNIKDYRGLRLEADLTEYSASDYESEIYSLRQAHSTLEAVSDRDVVEEGDVVEVSYSISIDGEVVEDTQDKTATVEMGLGRTLPEFEEALKGQKLEGETSFEHVYAEDFHHKPFAGKTAVFRIVPKQIKTRVLPELDDQLAVKTGLAETASDLKAKTEEEVRRRVEQSNERAMEKAFFDAVIEANPFDVPSRLIDQEIRAMIKEMGWSGSKKDIESVDVAPYREFLGEQAGFRVRSWIALNRIVQQEGTVLSDADWENWLNDRVKLLQRGREEVENLLGLPEEEEHWKNVACREHVLKDVLSTAQFSPKMKSGSQEGN